MKDAKRASKTFDAISDHFDNTRNRPWDEVVGFIERDKGNILDLGCGNGRHCKVAIDDGRDIVALDISRDLLDIAKEKIKEEKGRSNIEFIRGRFKAIPLADNQFENIIFIASLHHLSEGRVKALEEAKRVLKNGGNILISVWAREQDRWDLKEGEKDVFVPWTKENGEIIKRFYHLYTLDELIEDFEKSGLKISKAFQKKGNHYIEGYKK